MQDLFTIQSSVLPDDTRVVGFRGTEGLSRPYLFEIWLSIPSDSADFDMGDAIGARTSLLVDRGDAGHPPYVVHGVLWSLELALESNGRGLFRAELVPHLTQLTQTLHSRIFTKRTLPEILRETLEDGGLTTDDYELRLDKTYKPEEHVCQYRESHFDFLSRWLEREGLYYFFEQGDDREKLVITDHKAAHEPLRKGGVRYHPVSGHDRSAKESFASFTCKHVSLPASVKLVDYDYLKPTLEVTGSAPVSDSGLGEIHEHAARFFTPDDGKRLAKLRAEELLAQRVVYRAVGQVLHLRSGYLFDLEDHPRHAFNTRYLVTELVHTGNQGASTGEVRALTGFEGDVVYEVEVTAIPATVQYRPPRKTAWPRIYGYENGIVDGEQASEYAQIDEHGRYAVKFRFDESDLRDGKASTFVRMAQPHGGGVEGWHFPLRKGTEIIFTFLGGDPDRPVIAGVVPNSHTPSPVTRSNHTTNVIQTGGRNRFELEDKAGSQRITLQTPHTNTMIRMGAPNDDHNLICRTDGSALHDTGEDHDIEIGGHLHETVTGEVVEKYENRRETTVQADDKLTVEKGNLTIEVATGFRSSTIKTQDVTQVEGSLWSVGVPEGQMLQSTKGPWTVAVAEGEAKITAHEAVKIKAETGEITIEAPANNIQVTGIDIETTATGKWKWSCLSDHVALTVGATSETFVGVKNENTIGAKIETLIGLKTEFALAGKMDLCVGPKFDINPLGCKHGVFHMKTMASELHETEAKIEQALTRVTQHTTVITNHTLKMNVVALYMVT
jgi:type VI secretion system secreted protein VgrG